MLDFGREICSDLNITRSREWLVTNGLGSYASGAIAGMLTRRYHGLLIAALHPPLGRTLLATKLDETALYGGESYPLYANHWASGRVDCESCQYLERFHLDGTTPVWSFACADALLEKRIWMQPGANTTYSRYTLQRGKGPLTLVAKALVNYRDYHGSTHANGWRMQVNPVEHGLQVIAYDSATPFYLLSAQAEAKPQHDWYRDYFLSVEAYRGLDSREDHLCVGNFRAILQPGESFTLVASVDAAPNLDGDTAYSQRQAYEQGLIDQAKTEAKAKKGRSKAKSVEKQGASHLKGVSNTWWQPLAQADSSPPEWLRRLFLAADQFIVRRPTPADPDGQTIIAGYHWFSDWGRDTMISLPGLTLPTGRPEIAARILRTFARFVDQGMLPNRFPDAGETPEYNTADASLWYFEAIRAYHAATGDDGLLAELFPTLQEMITWHQQGTRYRIHVDPADGLLYAGEPGVQLTWMDAKVGDWVVTPRIGKPVEVNALWYNALRVMADFARRLRQPAEAYNMAAEQAKNGFARFWNEAAGYCYDVLDGPDGSDPALRPNQLLAVSLPYSPLESRQQRAVVDVCARRLLTSHGLRSLAPDHPAYVDHYGGDSRQRDGAYHQGTVWSWLMGPFVSAHLHVYGDRAQAQSYLWPLVRHLSGHGLGSISEIFDANPPFTPRGCIAQAWGVAELLRAWQATLTQGERGQSPG
ncbi:MAG: amylo-alpha-1,6-glucosidase [Anaerolineae bacterium]